jgi:hypothetical protein
VGQTAVGKDTRFLEDRLRKSRTPARDTENPKYQPRTIAGSGFRPQAAVWRILLCLIAGAAFVAAQTANNKIYSFLFDCSRRVSTGQTSGALLVCVNSNTSSIQRIRPGDSFTFQFSIGDGQIILLNPSVMWQRLAGPR